ncbi:CDGSH iron-sulfur domain-containing protein [Aliiroseovarius sp. PrR006]|uniref:CDGSH iron-sulfur domain-containing protein n=1 Tax=Aliiroseovarius sp. PrR006 TaxID=2706883 RepID=UPI0013D8104B|nr:CDGSH iron-sulfur domain-containing protein [Aliiroseovarius sp. PrR006]NDW53116.1 iron-binding protein [Aliiroseovarius sp. PrR006]
MTRKEYTGEEITVTFDLKRCIHARNCFLQLPDVFDPSKRPWVQPDKASAEEVAAMIRTCPSGALAFRRKTGVEERAPKINRLAVLENGPLVLAGDVCVEGGDRETRVALCRCGLSKNKPYCDYSHVEGGFEATGEPDPKTPPEIEEAGGPADVSRRQNGPLIIDGNLELCSGTGRRIGTVDKAFLCRCGHSKNKPFCDGSHKAAGFKDPAEPTS